MQTFSVKTPMTSNKNNLDHHVLIEDIKTPVMPSAQSEPGKKKLIFCFLGIFISYFVYGILQEKITKHEYGPNKERFTYTLALVFVQCIINAVFAKIAIRVFSASEDRTPMVLFATATMSYLGAMITSNHSLQYVPYPTQVLGKSVKPIPVMILGVLLARKRYPPAKYLFVLMIVIGVAMFMYKEKKSTGDSTPAHTLGYGEFLLIMSLTLDGLTGAAQDKMRSKYNTQTYHLMYNFNFYSIIYLGVALLLGGEGVQFLSFALKYPTVLFKMLTFSISSAIGQMFIFTTVIAYGPLTCSIFTTTRKFFTILGSVLIFGHTILARQWVGTILVFIGLGLDSAFGKERRTGVATKK